MQDKGLLVLVTGLKKIYILKEQCNLTLHAWYIQNIWMNPNKEQFEQSTGQQTLI